MPIHIPAPARIPGVGTKPKVIEEYIGRKNSGEARLSVARMRILRSFWVGAGPDAGFDEFTLVLSGALYVCHREGRLIVREGEAVVAKAGEWVQYSTPEGETEYVAICLPAFSPTRCIATRSCAAPGPE
ncbi:cupin [bacterium]|nr:cupin [bacterium]